MTQVAVLGTGSIGTRHLQVLREIGGVTPIAVPTRAERIAEWRAAGFATARNWDEARAQGATHGIVATETRRHFADARAALALRMNLLVEKPLTATVSDARELLAIAAKSSGQVFVGCVLRFSESLNVFRAWLPRIGAVHNVRVECQSYLPDWRPQRDYRESYSARAVDGGVLRDLVHELDYTCWLFGWPRALQARVRNLGRLGIEAEESADLLWETPKGATVSISLDYLSRPARRRLRASGEHATLEWDGIAGRVELVTDDGTKEQFGSQQSRDAMFLDQARAFIGASVTQHDERLAGGEDGLSALALCDAARESSEARCERAVAY